MNICDGHMVNFLGVFLTEVLSSWTFLIVCLFSPNEYVYLNSCENLLTLNIFRIAAHQNSMFTFHASGVSINWRILSSWSYDDDNHDVDERGCSMWELKSLISCTNLETVVDNVSYSRFMLYCLIHSKNCSWACQKHSDDISQHENNNNERFGNDKRTEFEWEVKFRWIYESFNFEFCYS